MSVSNTRRIKKAIALAEKRVEKLKRRIETLKRIGVNEMFHLEQLYSMLDQVEKQDAPKETASQQ